MMGLQNKPGHAATIIDAVSCVQHGQAPNVKGDGHSRSLIEITDLHTKMCFLSAVCGL
jgi:hypothetical protein